MASPVQDPPIVDKYLMRIGEKVFIYKQSTSPSFFPLTLFNNTFFRSSYPTTI